MNNSCSLCPRNCKVDRNIYKGYCGEKNNIRISRADLHMWEEPCISGVNGSGAVFFSGCQLKCVFCQNYEIANNKLGKTITADELCEVFFKLKDKGADNINLVTPDHFTPSVKYAVEKAKKQGISIPFIYNCSGYVKLESLKTLEGLIDVYLPDFKYFSPFVAKKYSNAPDYPTVAKAAINEMIRQTGECVFDEKGLIKKGVIVRHLVLPGNVSDSKKAISYLHKTYENKIYISIMNQYTPVNKSIRYKELLRTLDSCEYDEVIEFAIALGIENAFCQEEGTASEKFIPEFE